MTRSPLFNFVPSWFKYAYISGLPGYRSAARLHHQQSLEGQTISTYFVKEAVGLYILIST